MYTLNEYTNIYQHFVKLKHFIFFLPIMHSTAALKCFIYSFYIIFLVSSGQHLVSAQSELHPAPALQGSHFQCWLSQRNLSPHPGTAGSAAAPNRADGRRHRCHRGLGWQIWVAVTRRGFRIRHPGLEDHPAAFQPRGRLFRQVKNKKTWWYQGNVLLLYFVDSLWHRLQRTILHLIEPVCKKKRNFTCMLLRVPLQRRSKSFRFYHFQHCLSNCVFFKKLFQ